MVSDGTADLQKGIRTTEMLTSSVNTKDNFVESLSSFALFIIVFLKTYNCLCGFDCGLPTLMFEALTNAFGDAILRR